MCNKKGYGFKGLKVGNGRRDYSKVAKSNLANAVEAEIVEEAYDEFVSDEDKHE